MTFQHAIATCFAKYFTFSGRASRPEYWYFFLFLFLGSIATGILDSTLFGTDNLQTEVDGSGARFSAGNNGPIGAIFSLGTLIPTLSAGWRRMHDTGRSGLYLLYPLIVFFGLLTFLSFTGTLTALWASGDISQLGGIVGLIAGIAVLVLFISPLIVIWWLTRRSEPGPNAYGPNPHEVTP